MKNGVLFLNGLITMLMMFAPLIIILKVKEFYMLPKKRPPTHPGDMLLKEFLEPVEITQAQLASHLGWPYARLNEIIKGKRGVSAKSALALGEALGTGAEFWLNLQKNWDLWHSLQGHKAIKPLREFKVSKVALA